MRTRLIVAIAALMAASALVAVPEPAGSSAPSSARQIDSATLHAVAISLPAGSRGDDDSVPRHGDRARPDGSGPVRRSSSPARARRRRAARPWTSRARAAGVCNKNYWRYDTNVSWYGPGFFGSGTACGQTYTKTLMGVAHRTLPCGTLVTFRNPANGREVTVAGHRPRTLRRRAPVGHVRAGLCDVPRPLLHGLDRMAVGQAADTVGSLAG